MSVGARGSAEEHEAVAGVDGIDDVEAAEATPIGLDEVIQIEVPDVHVVETHSSVLFFVDDKVFKMKKAVDLGFLDFTSLEARQRACREEVALNRRLAPDAYLGVADVIGPDRQPMEHLVVMRRMPEGRRLAACVERGEDVDDALRAIARRLAALHDHRPPDRAHDRLASPAAVRARWVAGFEQLGDLVEEGRWSPDPCEARIEELVERFLDGRAPLLEHRIARGRIRDGHGDLQAEDIFLLPAGPQILDCLDFSEEYRWGDVLADAAFLAMDLDRLGRPDLADRFLALHREYGADTWPPSLAHHYLAYRAHVRAKVAVLRAVQAGEPSDPSASPLFELALHHLELGRVRLVVVGGAPGTGKSTVSTAIADALGAVVLRSDEVRAREPARGYAPAAVRRTYAELLDEAERLLARGEHVVIDATFRDEAERAAVRELAARTASDLTELRCCLDPEEAARRVVRRREEGVDASEATPEVARQLAASFDPWPEAIALDAALAPDEVAAAALAVVDGGDLAGAHPLAAALGDRFDELVGSTSPG